VESQSGQGDQTSRAPNRVQKLLANIKERELQHGHDLDSLVPVLQSSSANLRASAESALLCVINWFQECNSRRFSTLFRRTSKEDIEKRNQKLVGQLKELQGALEEFRTVERVKLIKPYERFFDPETKQLLKTADVFASRYPSHPSIHSFCTPELTVPSSDRCTYASSSSTPSTLSPSAFPSSSKSSSTSTPKGRKQRSGSQAGSPPLKTTSRGMISRARAARWGWGPHKTRLRLRTRIGVRMTRRRLWMRRRRRRRRSLVSLERRV
jgi:hypothetical protein